MPRLLAQLFGHLPANALAASTNLNGRGWTVLRFSSLIRRQHDATKALLNEVDLICIIDEVFHRLDIGISIKLNNRKILAGIATMRFTWGS